MNEPCLNTTNARRISRDLDAVGVPRRWPLWHRIDILRARMEAAEARLAALSAQIKREQDILASVFEPDQDPADE